MALLAEELVEEWLNRLGYFTIRGLRHGVQEMDLLAIRPEKDGVLCRHVEVQASVRPIGYLSRVPREIQRSEGRAAGSVKRRSIDELRIGVKEWVEKKFDHPAKQQLKNRLAPGPWSLELVVHRVRYPEELELIRQHHIKVHFLSEIVGTLKRADGVIAAASGAAFVDLVQLESSVDTNDAE